MKGDYLGNKFKEVFSKKILIEIYFIFFIFLNVIDFLNIIPNDLDFFKKLLSWSLIGLIFYRISITRLLIGVKKRGYDLVFLSGFSFMVLIRMLGYYINNFNGANLKTAFPVFWRILIFLPHTNNSILLFFLFGSLIVIINTIILISNFSYISNSFLGSFHFKDSFLGIVLTYVFGVFYSLFFGLIVFGFFMEWFALAIDSLILVVGVFYYVIHLFLKYSSSIKVHNLLSEISNFGNDLYYRLIELFSDKNSFFIGISALLLLHLIVDFGVYFVPFLLGNQNSLYSSSSSNFLSSHKSIFSLFDIHRSLVFSDLVNFNLNLFQTSVLILDYLIVYILFFFLMIFPLYVFYRRIMGKRVFFSERVLSLFFASFFASLSVFFLKGLSFPIRVGFFKFTDFISGVNITSHSLIENSKYMSDIYIFLFLFLFFYLIFIFLISRFNSWKSFFSSLILIIFIFYSISYIFIFFISIINNDYYNLTGKVLIKGGSLEGNNLNNLTYLDSVVIGLNEKVLLYNNTVFKRFNRRTYDITPESLSGIYGGNYFKFLKIDLFVPTNFTVSGFKNLRNLSLKNVFLDFNLSNQSLILIRFNYSFIDFSPFDLNNSDCLIFLNVSDLSINSSLSEFSSFKKNRLDFSGVIYKRFSSSMLFAGSGRLVKRGKLEKVLKHMIVITFLKKTKRVLIFSMLNDIFFIIRFIFNVVFYVGGLLALFGYMIKFLFSERFSREF